VLTPFTVPAVPTGMKRGVCTGPWGVWKQAQRALLRGQRALIVNEKGAAESPRGAALAAGAAVAVGAAAWDPASDRGAGSEAASVARGSGASGPGESALLVTQGSSGCKGEG
jgi:hypothetical protein